MATPITARIREFMGPPVVCCTPDGVARDARLLGRARLALRGTVVRGWTPPYPTSPLHDAEMRPHRKAAARVIVAPKAWRAAGFIPVHTSPPQQTPAPPFRTVPQ